MALLGAGAGAGEGLDEYLSRLLKEQAQAESVRHNQATEKLGQDTLQSLAGEREALAEARQQQIEDRQRAGVEEQQRQDYENQLIKSSDTSGALKNYFLAKRALHKGENPPPQLFLEPGAGVNSEQKTYRLTDPTLAQQLGKKVGDVIDADYNPRTNKTSYRGVDVTSGVGHYERPPQPIVIQSESGLQAVDRGSRTATPILGVDKKQVQPPEPTAMKMADRNAQRASGLLDRLSDLIDEADRRGLLGPAAGRASNYLAGTVGTTGNREDDLLLGALKLDMNSIPPEIALSIGEGARGASSVQLLQQWKNLFTPNGPDVMRGAISETRKLIAKPGTQGQQQPGGIPKPGEMFNGGRVLSVTPVQ